MRRVGSVLAVIALVVAGPACDTSQPSVGGSTSAEVQIEARALVELFDCYDRYVGTTFDSVVCYGPAPFTEIVNRPVPWHFAFRVAMLLAGETFPVVVAGSVNTDEFEVFESVTRFDVEQTAAPIRLDEPPYNFQNPRRVSQGHQDYFIATVNFTDGRPDNVRGPLPLPVVNILGITSPSPGVSPRFPVELHAGDSLIVEATKQLRVLGPPIFPQNIDPNLTLNARLFVGGAEATPHAGTVQSSPADGSGISFNYISD